MSVRLAGAAIFLIAAFYTWVGRDYSAPFGDVLGPAVFPIIVGIPTMIFSASLVIFPSGQVAWPDWPHIARQAAALAVLVGYALLLKPLGFPIATFGLIAALGIVLGGRPTGALVLGAAMSIGLWVLFDRILGLPLAFLGSFFGGALMETLSLLAGGFSVALTPLNMTLLLVGCFVGTLIGAMPGLGPVNGVAILIPLTFAFRLDATSSLILLSAVYFGTMYGGRISSILLNIPGDEPAVMTTLDGYPMAQQGRAADALALSGVASFVGATVAVLGLSLFAPLLARAAIHFGPADYFALYVLAFATIGGIAGIDPRKTLLSALIGLMIATVGLDPISGIPRFTAGNYHIYDGIEPIVALVGLFAISEILLLLERHVTERTAVIRIESWLPDLRTVFATRWAMARGSVIGFVAGVLPGAGASLGAVMSYSMEKQVSDKNGTFGKGDPRGVAAPEAGNNAASGGALIPMLSLGVPGSGTTAVMLAMLISLNVQPGPLLFERQPELVWGLVASLYMANVTLLILNLPMIGLFARLMAVPTWALMPIVAAVSFVGVFSISNSVFDLEVMIAFGVLGYVLRKLDFSLVPMVLGLLLGGDMERNLRRAMSISDGDWGILIASPISIVLYVLTAGFLALSVWLALRESRRGQARLLEE